MIVVCGQPRSGTSMVMRMLEMGGIPLNYSVVRNRPDLMAKFRNPYGFYEMIPITLTGNFKCIWPKLVPSIPLTAKLIRITRTQAAMVASWEAVNGSPLMNARVDQIAKMRTYWDEVLATREHLSLDYDVVVSSPQAAAQQISDFIVDPFDVINAAKAVDKALYINRNKE